MADTSTTGNRKRRSVNKSEFYSDVAQREWLELHNDSSDKDLLEDLKMVHARLFHDVFIVPQTSEHGKADNRRRNEVVEDLATILKSRGVLPPEFEAYALGPQDLPWKPQILPTLPCERSRS